MTAPDALAAALCDNCHHSERAHMDRIGHTACHVLHCICRLYLHVGVPTRPTPPAEPGLREALERLLREMPPIAEKGQESFYKAVQDARVLVATPSRHEHHWVRWGQFAARCDYCGSEADRAFLAAAPQAALDVERLARAMVASDPSHHLADRCEGCERNAKRIAAAYARAGEGDADAPR